MTDEFANIPIIDCGSLKKPSDVKIKDITWNGRVMTPKSNSLRALKKKSTKQTKKLD